MRTLRDRESGVAAPKLPPVRLPKTVARTDASAATDPKHAKPSPREICGDRNFVTRAICLNRQCQSAHARGLPECAKVVQAEAERQRRMDQQ